MSTVGLQLVWRVWLLLMSQPEHWHSRLVSSVHSETTKVPLQSKQAPHSCKQAHESHLPAAISACQPPYPITGGSRHDRLVSGIQRALRPRCALLVEACRESTVGAHLADAVGGRGRLSYNKGTSRAVRGRFAAWLAGHVIAGPEAGIALQFQVAGLLLVDAR